MTANPSRPLPNPSQPPNPAVTTLALFSSPSTPKSVVNLSPINWTQALDWPRVDTSQAVLNPTPNPAVIPASPAVFST